MNAKHVDIRILENTISIEECRSFVKSDLVGGEVLFVGTVRSNTKGKNVVRLEFESYQPMAIVEMEKICAQIFDQWPILKIAIHHRIGVLEIGEIAVCISVSGAHRKEAFAACQYAIDTLKETVPIWKKEVFEDGDVWVAAHP